MRPSPMNPHVARFAPLDANDLRVPGVAVCFGGVPLPSTQSRDGEKRTFTVALIAVACKQVESKMEWAKGMEEGRGSEGFHIYQ